jgi:hypothetical protein
MGNQPKRFDIMDTNPNMGCPAGLLVDGLNRYSGCNISSDLDLAMSITNLISWNLMGLILLFGAFKLQEYDQHSPPLLVRRFIGIGIGGIPTGNAWLATLPSVRAQLTRRTSLP